MCYTNLTKNISIGNLQKLETTFFKDCAYFLSWHSYHCHCHTCLLIQATVATDLAAMEATDSATEATVSAVSAMAVMVVICGRGRPSPRDTVVSSSLDIMSATCKREHQMLF